MSENLQTCGYCKKGFFSWENPLRDANSAFHPTCFLAMATKPKEAPMTVDPYPITNRKQYTLRDMPEFQERLSEQVDMWLEELLRREDTPEDEVWNAKVTTLLKDWRAGQGPLAAEAGRHIEAICDAVKGALK